MITPIVFMCAPRRMLSRMCLRHAIMKCAGHLFLPTARNSCGAAPWAWHPLGQANPAPGCLSCCTSDEERLTVCRSEWMGWQLWPCTTLTRGETCPKSRRPQTEARRASTAPSHSPCTLDHCPSPSPSLGLLQEALAQGRQAAGIADLARLKSI